MALPHSDLGTAKVPPLIRTKIATTLKNLMHAVMAYLSSITPLDVFEHTNCTPSVKEAHVLHSYQVKHGGVVQQTV